MGRLCGAGHDVHHFALLADRETVLRRLRERAFGRLVGVVAGQEAQLRREGFAVSRLDLCLDRLAEPLFAEHIWTDNVDIPAVAEKIAEESGLALAPNTDSPARAQLRRTWTSARHIRFD